MSNAKAQGTSVGRQQSNAARAFEKQWLQGARGAVTTLRARAFEKPAFHLERTLRTHS